MLEYPKKAILIFQQSLEIREKVLGKEHPDTAASYNAIGVSLSYLGRHEEALEYYEKSIGIRKKVLGKEHPDTAESYWAIGVSLGRYEEALEYHQKSIEIREKVLGKEHPDMAESYNAIGVSLWHLGRHEEALGNCQKAFQVLCKAYKRKHPSLELYLQNLIGCLNEQLNQKHREKIIQEVLLLCIEKFGEEDTFTQLFRRACAKDSLNTKDKY